MTTVVIVKEWGKSALVEWHAEGAHRALVPRDAILDGQASDADLTAGIPYGVAWEDVLPVAVTPEAITRELRRAGIWTLGDLQAQPTVALAALQRVLGLHLAALRRAAEQYEKRGG